MEAPGLTFSFYLVRYLKLSKSLLELLSKSLLELLVNKPVKKSANLGMEATKGYLFQVK